MPGHFLKNIDKYAENKCVIFSGLGFFDIGINVMTKNWDVLAEHYVHLGKTKKTKAEVIEDLKLRVTPIHRTNRATNVIKKD